MLGARVLAIAAVFSSGCCCCPTRPPCPPTATVPEQQAQAPLDEATVAGAYTRESSRPGEYIHITLFRGSAVPGDERVFSAGVQPERPLARERHTVAGYWSLLEGGGLRLQVVEYGANDLAPGTHIDASIAQRDSVLTLTMPASEAKSLPWYLGGGLTYRREVR